MENNTATIDVRPVGQKVIIISRNGIEKGEITMRSLEKDNRIKYGVRVQSIKTNIHRYTEEVFDKVDDLLQYYKAEFKENDD